MIVKNEAHCLGDCLASVRDIADEIIIGDTGSTDDTVDVAMRFDATVIDVPWHDDFALARNEVLNAATGDWCLHLDADEVVDPKAAERIAEIVAQDGDGAQAYELTMANYCDEYTSWRWLSIDPDSEYARGFSGYVAVPLIRLFKNGLGFEYREAVHESLTESVRERDSVVRGEPFLIHHYGFDPNHPRNDTKVALYLRIGEKKVEERPDDAKAWHDLASASHDSGDHERAETSVRKALELDPAMIDSAAMLTEYLINRGDAEEAKSLMMGFVERGDTPPHFVNVLGSIAFGQGDYKEARRWYDLVLEAVPTHLMTLLDSARAHDQLGNIAEAKANLERAREIAPALKEPRTRLAAFELRCEGEEHVRAQRYGEAVQAFGKALDLDASDPIVHNNVGVVLNALGRRDEAEKSFRQALAFAPDMAAALKNLNLL